MQKKSKVTVRLFVHSGEQQKKIRAGEVLKSTLAVLLVSLKTSITTLGIHWRNQKILFWR
jgi:hypothetical protein